MKEAAVPRKATAASKTRARPGIWDQCSFLLVLLQPTPGQRQALAGKTAPLRLRPFRRAFGGHETPAMELYWLDAKISSHIHAQLRIVEVVLRQQMHESLKAQYGARWFDSSQAGLSRECKGKVAEAKSRVQRAQPQGRRSGNPGQRTRPPASDTIIAELMMGFWAALLRQPGDAQHLQTLWSPALNGCFNQNRQSHQQVWQMHDALKVCQRLNWARNRVNHCESVVFGFPQPGQGQGVQIRYSPGAIVQECRALVGRFDREVEAWMRSSSAVDHLIAAPAAKQALAYSASQARRRII